MNDTWDCQVHTHNKLGISKTQRELFFDPWICCVCRYEVKQRVLSAFTR